jgi:hypothetical protein
LPGLALILISASWTSKIQVWATGAWFMCLFSVGYHLWWNVCLNLLPIFKLSCILLLSCRPFIRYITCKYFLPICGLSSFS